MQLLLVMKITETVKKIFKIVRKVAENVKKKIILALMLVYGV